MDHMEEPIQITKHRVGDGCYHVFIDVGANIGVHGRFLFEPENYPLSNHSVALFAEKYGYPRTNEDVCVFEIEANPNHWDRLEEVSLAYRTLGWRYIVVKGAAHDRNGSSTFFHQGDGDYNEWGFSARNSKLKRPKSETGRVEVPSIRLSKWIQEEIFGRQVPRRPPSKSQYSKPVVGMKLDIEGSEFFVLPDLLLSGIFCELDFIFGETHEHFAPFKFVDKHQISLQNSSEALSFLDAMWLVLDGSRQCVTEFLLLDDEAYLFDGVPLPTANQ